MKILLSPAKSLDYESLLPTTKHTKARFVNSAVELNEVLKNKSEKEIAKLMKISSNLADLNYERYARFQKKHGSLNSRPAIFAFAGDVYTGFDAYSLNEEQTDVAQKQVRILSGLYGVLRPLDRLQPYRLEMGTQLEVGDHKNLYEFWKEKVTPSLNREMRKNELLVNLASQEYFKVIDQENQKGKIIAPIFKDHKNGKLKIISFYAKRARGAMARHLVNKKASELDDILSFATDGYSYSTKHTEREEEPVFIR
jgi:hypothetical protein